MAVDLAVENYLVELLVEPADDDLIDMTVLISTGPDVFDSQKMKYAVLKATFGPIAIGQDIVPVGTGTSIAESSAKIADLGDPGDMYLASLANLIFNDQALYQGVDGNTQLNSKLGQDLNITINGVQKILCAAAGTQIAAIAGQLFTVGLSVGGAIAGTKAEFRGLGTTSATSVLILTNFTGGAGNKLFEVQDDGHVAIGQDPSSASKLIVKTTDTQNAFEATNSNIALNGNASALKGFYLATNADGLSIGVIGVTAGANQTSSVLIDGDFVGLFGATGDNIANTSAALLGIQNATLSGSIGYGVLLENDTGSDDAESYMLGIYYHGTTGDQNLGKVIQAKAGFQKETDIVFMSADGVFNFADINSLGAETDLEDGADYFMMWDNSEGKHVKVLIDAFVPKILTPQTRALPYIFVDADSGQPIELTGSGNITIPTGLSEGVNIMASLDNPVSQPLITAGLTVKTINGAIANVTGDGTIGFNVLAAADTIRLNGNTEA